MCLEAYQVNMADISPFLVFFLFLFICREVIFPFTFRYSSVYKSIDGCCGKGGPVGNGIECWLQRYTTKKLPIVSILGKDETVEEALTAK